MYTDVNYSSKKEFKEAIAKGEKVRVYNPGPFGPPPSNGNVAVEGPHSPKPHKWYAQVTLKDGFVVKVK